MKKKSNKLIINQFKKIAEINVDMQRLDKDYIKIEHKYFSYYNKLAKKLDVTKGERMQVYKDFKDTFNNRLSKIRKYLELKK
jgi:hypothetical protein